MKNSDAPTTVLVVEDDPDLNRLTQDTLRRAGFHTEGASCGADAVAMVLQNPYTLLVLDYFLPDMVGSQVMEALAEWEHETPFIAMTGRGDERIAVEMMKLGARDYVTKGPGFRQMLPEVVKKVCSEIKTKRRLAETEQRLGLLSLAAEQSTEGIGIFDEKGRLVFVNQALASMHGYAPQELLGRDLFTLHRSDQTASVTRALERVRETGGISGEMEHVRRDGTAFPASVRLLLLRGGTGISLGMVGTFRDVTEEKHTEDALQTSARRLVRFLDGAPDGFALFDEQLRAVEVSRALLSLHKKGTGKEDLIGKGLREVLPGFGRTAGYRKCQQALKAGDRLLVEEHITDLGSKRSKLSVRAFTIGGGLGVIVTGIAHTTGT